VVIPGVLDRRFSTTASGETRPRKIEPGRPREPGRTSLHSRVEEQRSNATGGPSPTSVAAVPTGGAADGVPSESAAAVSPSTRFPTTSGIGSPAPHQTARKAHIVATEKPHSTSGELPAKPQAVPRGPRIVAAANTSDFLRERFEDESWPMPPRAEAAVRHRLPDGSAGDILRTTRSLPSARRQDQTISERSAGRRSDPHRHGSAGAISTQMPAGPPPQQPVIVLNQPADLGAPPVAFWERRHLSHLHVRIRR
jgi:hypothetical protein